MSTTQTGESTEELTQTTESNEQLSFPRVSPHLLSVRLRIYPNLHPVNIGALMSYGGKPYRFITDMPLSLSAESVRAVADKLDELNG